MVGGLGTCIAASLLYMGGLLIDVGAENMLVGLEDGAGVDWVQYDGSIFCDFIGDGEHDGILYGVGHGVYA